jgi:hypothetical protein
MIRYLHIRDKNRIPYGTVCYEFTKDGKLVFGASLKSPTDREFSKEIGRHLAYKRFKQTLDENSVACVCNNSTEFISFEMKGIMPIDDNEQPFFSFIQVPVSTRQKTWGLVVALVERL